MTKTPNKSTGKIPLAIALSGTGLLAVAVGMTFWTMSSNKPYLPVTATSNPATPAAATASPAPATAVASTGTMASPSAAKTTGTSARPLTPDLPTIRAAYKRGEYKAVEQATKTVRITKVTNVAKPLSHEELGQMEYLAAFASARQGNMRDARDHFAAIVQEEQAYHHQHPSADSHPLILPPGQAPTILVGDNEPHGNLEERAAFQRAVCIFALHDKAGAEAAFTEFMRHYPDSPLVAAAVKRIGRLHGGDIPKPAEAVWREAVTIAGKHQDERQREASLCGPAVFAEVLCRKEGIVLSPTAFTERVNALAKEMSTSKDGTTLASLVATAKKHGFYKAEGVALTSEGLQKLLAEKRTVVALLGGGGSGHYVLVEKLGSDGTATVWDGNAEGLLQPGTRKISPTEWTHVFSQGYAVVL